MAVTNFDLRRDHQKISYERRDYESVDEKSLSWAICSEKLQKNNSGSKGLHKFIKLPYKFYPNYLIS